MSKKILITGATGLVGSRFVELYPQKENLLTPSTEEVDITSSESIKKYFETKKPDVVINFAAFTNVDGAEKERGDEKGMTWKINFDGPKNLAEVCKKNNIFLIQISTDFVFTGTEDNHGPYSELSPIAFSLLPTIGWYGWSKNRAEEMLKNSGVRHAIVRIAYPFYKAEYSRKLDFAKGFLKLFDENKLYPVFSDQTLSVVNVDDLVEPLSKIIENQIEGTFHLVASDTTTPFEFVSYLLEKVRGAKDVLQKGSMKEFLSIVGRTPRPRLGGFKTEITQEKLGIKFKTWKEMVDEFVEKS